MPRAVLISGFSSWGKTKHIQMLFDAKRFAHRPYRPTGGKINGDFLVESRSNDDVGHGSFIRNVDQRYMRSGREDLDLVAGFCPSRELNNDARVILSSKEFQRFSEIQVFLLQYKWDWHAEIIIAEVRDFLLRDRRINLVIVNEDANFVTDLDRLSARDASLRKHFASLYP